MNLPRRLVRVCALGVLAGAAHAFAQVPAPVRERVEASYLLAFGRTANDAEVNYWAKQHVASVGDLVNLHRQYLHQDANTHRATITRAYVDAMGRNPTAAEISYWSSGTDTYTQLMKNHVAWLAGNPAEYEAVIKRSYQAALGRQPNADEIRYWKSQGTLSYLMLVACHQDWKQRNGARAKTGGPLTVSTTSGLLAQVSVSPPIAAEARTAAGVVGTNGGNVIAAGAGNVIAAGGGNLIATGGGNLIASGGGNVVGQGGASVIAAGAGNLIATGGGN